jgi:pyruvate,water dikinase
MARYGVLAETVDVEFVNGHPYIAPRPLVGSRDMTRTPPYAALWLISRVHPVLRRRARAARRALDHRPWRDVAQHWFSVERDEWRARADAIERCDPASMSSTELAEHSTRCRALVTAGYRRHFELHGDDLLPVGLLITRCAEWGVEPDTALRAVEGASAELAGSQPPDWQLVTGYDLDSLAWCELGESHLVAPSVNTGPLDLRPHVEPEHHEELQRLVEDARAAVPLRDDNGAITGAWPMGLLRRAMIEAGRRIAAADPTLAIEATIDELAAALEGVRDVSADALSERRLERVRCSQLDAPLTLGPELAIPPLDALPSALATIGAAQLASADHMFGHDRPVGVGTESYVGRALVVDDPNHALDVLEPGDVVITSCTSPTWNHVLARAGAVVTTTGGLVSHAAVLARELDIPAVIGDRTATGRLRTGQLVTVDPTSATVTAAHSPRH